MSLPILYITLIIIRTAFCLSIFNGVRRTIQSIYKQNMAETCVRRESGKTSRTKSLFCNRIAKILAKIRKETFDKIRFFIQNLI